MIAGKHISPLRYPGGKNCIFPFVSSLLEENGVIGVEYAEPYAGGAGLALRLLFENKVSHIHINDLDPSIYAFWYVCLNESERFCSWIEKVDVNIDNWNYYKEIQNKETDIFLLAQSTFFLNRTNISGVIKGGVIGGKRQLGKYKIDARFNKADLICRIKAIASKKKQITLTQLDGLDFIKKINRKRKDIFIYLDPPYVEKGATLYMNYFRKDNHENLRNQVLKLRKKWIVSYDNTPLIKELYCSYNMVYYQLSQCASNRIGDEVVVFSGGLIYDRSISFLKNPII